MRHGTHSAYVAGCRCEECRRGHADYMADWSRRRAYGRLAYVDADLARARLAELLAMGYTRREICRIAGLGRGWLKTLERPHWRTGKPVERCSRSNFEALMAVTGRSLRPGQLVDARPGQLIVRRLHDAGLSVPEMGRAAGMDPQPLYALLNGEAETCEAKTLVRLLAHLGELEARCPSDPRGERAEGLSPCAEAAQMEEMGCSRAEAAARCGVKPESVRDWERRHAHA